MLKTNQNSLATAYQRPGNHSERSGNLAVGQHHSHSLQKMQTSALIQQYFNANLIRLQLFLFCAFGRKPISECSRKFKVVWFCTFWVNKDPNISTVFFCFKDLFGCWEEPKFLFLESYRSFFKGSEGFKECFKILEKPLEIGLHSLNLLHKPLEELMKIILKSLWT